MKKIIITSFILSVPLFLIGCADEKEKVLTVEEFKETKNDEIRQEWMVKCKDNPGELRENPNCINAFEAQKKLQSERIIEKYSKPLD